MKKILGSLFSLNGTNSILTFTFSISKNEIVFGNGIFILYFLRLNAEKFPSFG